MKHKYILSCALAALVCLSGGYTTSVNKKSIWGTYRPAQAGIVGQTIKSYDSKSQGIAFGGLNFEDGYNVEFVDQPSTASDKQTFDKAFTLELKGLLQKNASSIRVESKNAVVTSIKSLKGLKPGVFVYGGVKCDEATVYFSRKTSTEVKPEELAKQLEVAIKALNPTIAQVAGLVTQIKSESSGETSFAIKNPNIYLFFQPARLTQGTLATWLKDFVWSENDGKPFVLSSSKPVTSTTISPVISSAFRGSVEPIGIRIMRQEESGVPELYAEYTTSSGTGKIKIPKFSGSANQWSVINFIIREYDLDSNHYKVIKLALDAVSDNDKNVTISKAQVSYPESTVEILNANRSI